MEADAGDEARPLPGIDRVRCLGCGALYVKPAGGGTVSANPGCPECGYVGWASPLTKPPLQHHSAGDQLRRRAG
jgi:hypothetical protein